jgi:glycosyltransferase involved in cell wall biosynthesis
MKISLITPMYNEEKVIANSIANLVDTLKSTKKDWEIILVDDGSKDDSRKVAINAAKMFPGVKVVGYKNNRGRGYALREGFKHFSGDIIITTESDMSWGKPTIISMIEELSIHPELDMIIASPHLKGGGYKEVPFFRVALSAIGNILLGKAFGNKLTMLSGMTRGYRREVIESINLESDGKEIHLEIASKALALGYKIKEIPAILSWEYKPKNNKKTKKKSSFNAKKLIISHLVWSFNESPIILLGSLSALFIFIGAIIFGYLLYTYFAGNLNPVRPLMFLAIILMIIGVQIIIFSFLAYQNKDLKKQSLIVQRDILRLNRKIK